MPTLLNLSVGGMPVRTLALEPVAHPERDSRKHPAVVLLHGAGGHVDFWMSRLGPFLQDAGVAVYAPHYFDRTSTVRADLATITDGVHVPQWLEVVRSAVESAAARPGTDPERIVLAGISLGAFLALAFAAGNSTPENAVEGARLRAVMEISGGLVEPYASVATGSFPPTLILHGATDTVVPVQHAHDLAKKLGELQVPHRTEILPDEGHWFSPASMPRLLFAVSAFLQEHLRM